MERKIIFKAKVGSHLYGLQRPDSDIDYYSVFIPTTRDLLGLDPDLGLQKCDMIDNSTKSSSENKRNTKEDIDDVSYSLPKYLHLVLQNNPNIVETLFARPESIKILEPEFQFLMDNYDKIISKRVFYTFTGYAFDQKRKLIVKSERYKSLVEAVANIEAGFTPEEIKDSSRAINDFEAGQLVSWVKYYKGKKQNCESFHKGMSLKMIYEKLVSERDNYGWRVKTDTFKTLGYDVKFGYHLCRVIGEAVQLLETGRLNYPITGELYKDISAIRDGKIELNELYKIYEKYDERAKILIDTTFLRDEPDFNWANDWLIKTLKEYIRREKWQEK